MRRSRKPRKEPELNSPEETTPPAPDQPVQPEETLRLAETTEPEAEKGQDSQTEPVGETASPVASEADGASEQAEAVAVVEETTEAAATGEAEAEAADDEQADAEPAATGDEQSEAVESVADPQAEVTETDADDGEDPEAEEATDEVSGETQAESGESTEPAPEVTTEQIVEAVLFGADTPLTPAKIVSIIGTGSARDVRKHIEDLNQRYEQTGASFRIEKIAGGYQMLTLPSFNAWLKRLKQTRQESKLSQAAMETLAVVAYKQPVVRAEIEAIRGVAAGETLNRLRELGLVKIVGRAEDVGRPLLYGTTKRFLDVFGLGSLDDLPTVEELKAPG